MGRGGADCSGAHAAAARCSERLLDLAGVDQLLEPAADLLACSEEIVIAPPAGREMHDANTVVALAVTAGVCGRLIEGPETVCVTPQPRHLGTPSMRPVRFEPGSNSRPRSLRTNRSTFPSFHKRPHRVFHNAAPSH